MHRGLGKGRTWPHSCSRFPLWQARAVPHHRVYSRLLTAEEFIIEWVIVIILKVTNFNQSLLLTIVKFHFSL